MCNESFRFLHLFIINQEQETRFYDLWSSLIRVRAPLNIHHLFVVPVHLIARGDKKRNVHRIFVIAAGGGGRMQIFISGWRKLIHPFLATIKITMR